MRGVLREEAREASSWARENKTDVQRILHHQIDSAGKVAFPSLSLSSVSAGIGNSQRQYQFVDEDVANMLVQRLLDASKQANEKALTAEASARKLENVQEIGTLKKAAEHVYSEAARARQATEEAELILPQCELLALLEDDMERCVGAFARAALHKFDPFTTRSRSVQVLSEKFEAATKTAKKAGSLTALALEAAKMRDYAQEMQGIVAADTAEGFA